MEPYEADLEDVSEHLRLKGKTIATANRENPTWLSYYDQRRIELKTLVDYVEAQTKRSRGRLYNRFAEHYQRELDHRAIERYIDNEDAYLRWYEIYLEVKELYGKFQSAVEAFTARGYALKNITELYVAGLGDAEL